RDDMRIATATIIGLSPYSQSKHHDIPAAFEKESNAAYDLRTWREHCTVDDNDVVAIPGMAIKLGLELAASKFQERVPEKGQKTWKDFINGGVFPAEQCFPVWTPGEGRKWKPLLKSEIGSIPVFCHANGKRRTASRVIRTYPIVNKWRANISLHVVDDVVTEEVLRRYLEEVGSTIGIGRFRPENSGMNGRFLVKDFAMTAFIPAELA